MVARGEIDYPAEKRSEDEALIRAISNNCCVYGTFVEIMRLNAKRYLVDTPIEEYLKRKILNK